jgi:hypothetical protein
VGYHKPQVENDSILDNRRVVPCKHTDISGVSTASTIRAMTEAMRTLLKRRSTPTKQHGATAEKGAVFKLAAVRT